MMHRTHAGGLLAVAVPGALALNPWLAVPVLSGLAVTRCLTAWVAALVGCAVMLPEATPIFLVALPVIVWTRHRLAPGAIIDTTRARLISWIYLCREWSWRGHGAGSARLALEAAHIRSGGRALEGGPARNEWLELLYEYGVFGAVPLIGLLVWIALSFAPRDALSASVIAAVVVCGGTSPLRAFDRWLRGDRDRLFGPPLKASLSIHIDCAENVHLYGSADRSADRATQAGIARALVQAANAICEQHHITIEELTHAR